MFPNNLNLSFEETEGDYWFSSALEFSETDNSFQDCRNFDGESSDIDSCLSCKPELPIVNRNIHKSLVFNCVRGKRRFRHYFEDYDHMIDVNPDFISALTEKDYSYDFELEHRATEKKFRANCEFNCEETESKSYIDNYSDHLSITNGNSLLNKLKIFIEEKERKEVQSKISHVHVDSWLKNGKMLTENEKGKQGRDAIADISNKLPLSLLSIYRITESLLLASYCFGLKDPTHLEIPYLAINETLEDTLLKLGQEIKTDINVNYLKLKAECKVFKKLLNRINRDVAKIALAETILTLSEFEFSINEMVNYITNWQNESDFSSECILRDLNFLLNVVSLQYSNIHSGMQKILYALKGLLALFLAPAGWWDCNEAIH